MTIEIRMFCDGCLDVLDDALGVPWFQTEAAARRVMEERGWKRNTAGEVVCGHCIYPSEASPNG